MTAARAAGGGAAGAGAEAEVATVQLIVVEREGVRLAVPAARVSAIDELPPAERRAPLQERLGQPPVADGERCLGLCVEGADGGAIVEVAGKVSMAAVPASDIAALPPLLAGHGLVRAVVFAGAAPLLVLDPDALVAQARAAE